MLGGGSYDNYCRTWKFRLSKLRARLRSVAEKVLHTVTDS